MIPNANITIWNKYVDPDTRTEVYQRTEIPAVVWQSTQAISRAKEQVAANLATVFIPVTSNVNYVSPRTWQALTDKSGYWTLQEGDIVARGIHAHELTTEYTATNLRADHDNVFMITSVDVMDQGSAYMWHYQIGLK